jgi:ubiquinone/menaquinone biosynthesis C-methylase UbiE
MAEQDYILGANDHELARLDFQHDVWSGVTRELLERAGVRSGERVLDAGAGPGFATALIRELVGERGRVLALDEAERWRPVHEQRNAERGWSNVAFRVAKLEQLGVGGDGHATGRGDIEPGSFDVVYLRWVLSFVPDPVRVLANLARALAPNGRLVVHDYNHEGISVFPESAGFRASIRATRAWYASAGGDTFVMGHLPRHLRAAGLRVVEHLPRVLCGGPDSPPFRWAGAFFPHYSRRMVEAGLMTVAERDQFLREWSERERDPDAMFFSPIVTGTIATRA